MRLLAALALGLMMCGAQAAEPFAAERVAWNKPFAPFHLIGNIYYVGTDDLAVFLIVTPKGDILLDGGLPESTAQIEKNIETLGFKLSDIKILLNSHAHFDHAGGLAELKRATGAKLIASAPDTPILERGDISYGPSAGLRYPPVHVDQSVGDGFKLDLGGVEMVAHLTPGHTPGCTSWTTTVRDKGRTLAVVFYGSTTVAGNPLVGNTEYPTIVQDYRASFAKLMAMKADVFFGAHGSFFHLHDKVARLTPGGPNPFVDPGELQRVIAASEKDFDAELKRQQAEKH
jgi:metallo-beta-lactamase class B